MGDGVRDVTQEPGASVGAGSVEVVVESDAAGVARTASHRVGEALRQATAAHGAATLALSGGNTPRAAYALLAHAVGIDWTRVDVFWVDERAVPPDHDRSNYRAAEATLLAAAQVPAARVHRMKAEGQDRALAAREYEELLVRHVRPGPSGIPSFDALVLGMGDDGHTASLFPGEPSVTTTDRWVVDVPAKAEREPRLTLTAPVIQNAAGVFILVVGADKRAPLLRAWAPRGEERETPIRIVRSCRGAVTWIGDRAAVGSAVYA